jgi:acetyltransferase-like isoleucine patch superfamily enzyme
MGQKNQDQEEREPFLKKVRRYGFLPALRAVSRGFFMKMRWLWLTRFWGMDIHPDTLISLKALLDRTNPRGIHIGEGTAVSFEAVILAHDTIRDMHECDTVIGKFCQIGARSFIMPGIKIGDHCVVGAATVVTKDVPSGSVIVGNPGRIVRTGIMTERWGRMIDEGEPAVKG